jgi:hypothetical protein
MERRLRHDFSQVRVHSDPVAVASARAVRARAYTVGHDVVLGEATAPSTPRGRGLLAHELTHVVQQTRGSGIRAGIDPEAGLEREADRAARAVVRGEPRVPTPTGAGIGLARAPEDIPSEEQRDDARRDDGEGERDREDDIDRSFAGLGIDDTRPKAEKAPHATTDPSASTSQPKASAPPTPPDEVDLAFDRIMRTDDVERPRGPSAPSGPFMSAEEGHDFLLSRRGFDNALGVGNHLLFQRRLRKLDKRYGTTDDRKRVKALKQQIKAAQAKYGERSAEYHAKTFALRLELSERKQRLSIQRRLAISTPRGGGGPAGVGNKTYAIIDVVDANGLLVRRVTATNRPPRKGDPDEYHERKGGVHAEESIVLGLREWIAQNPEVNKPRLKGAHIQVIADQTVCGSKCQTALSKFATDFEVEKVRGISIHRISPDALSNTQLADADLGPAKQPAVHATGPKGTPREQMAVREELIYDRRIPADLHGEVTVRRLRPRPGPGGTGGPQDGGPPPAHGEPTAADPHATSPTLTHAPAHPPPTTSSGAHQGQAPAGHVQPTKPVPAHDSPVAHAPAQSGHAPHTAGDSATHGAAKSATAHPTSTEGHPPAAAPARPPTRADRATNRLSQADMALSAIRDYERYVGEYKTQGLSEAEARLKASARAGLTLAANVKGGPAGNVVNAVNAFLNAKDQGQGTGEAGATALATVAGGIIGNKVAPTGPAGAAVQLINTAAQVLGAPQGVQDTTYVAAELVPSSIIGTTITTGGRSIYNLGVAAVTGDASGIDRLGKDMEAGGTGPWIQGYAQWTGIGADMASGDSFGEAIEKAAKRGKGSWADRVGTKLGDAAFDLGQNKEAIAGKYGPGVGGLAIGLNIAASMARGESFSKAFKSAQGDMAEGQKVLKAKITANIAHVKTAVKAKYDDAKAAVKATYENTKTAVKTTYEDTKAAVAAKYEDTKAAVKEQVTAATAKVEAVVEEAKTRAVEKWEGMKTKVHDNVDAARTAAASAYDATRTEARRLWDKIW